MATVNVRDTNLYYEMTGSGEPPLLFIHGMCGSSRNWEDQMDRLSPHFTCVAYDRRGHSRSDAGDEDQSVRTHAEDAAAIIEALGLRQPVIVGSSAGGAIAVELLHRHPDIVRGAVVIEPPLLDLEPGAKQAILEELSPVMEGALETGGPREAVDAFFQKVCTQYWSQADEAKKDHFRDNAPMLFATLEALGATVTPDDLAKIHHPVYVVTASDSFPLGRLVAERLAEFLPNSRINEFEDCGHVVYAEKPAEFAQGVLDFVRETAAPDVAAARSR